MTLDEQLNKIVAKCHEIIALGEKRTQGEWFASERGMYEDDGVAVHADHRLAGKHVIAIVKATASDHDEQTEGNAAFIAACAGPAEAMAKATVAAIEGLRYVADRARILGEGASYANATQRLDAIADAFPEELL